MRANISPTMDADAAAKGASGMSDRGGTAFIDALAPTLLSVGEQLRAGREGRGLTTLDVSKMLKLSPTQVEALEADDWSRLPCNTIIRGFVRNYARALHLDAAALMLALDAASMPALPELTISAGTNVRVPVENRLARRDFLKVFSGFALLAFALLAYFFFPQDAFYTAWTTLKSALPPSLIAATKTNAAAPEAKTPENTTTPPASSVVAAPDNAPGQPPAAPTAAPSPDAVTVAAPALTPLAASPAAALASAALPVAVTAAGGEALKFSFRQPSWVEVRDRSGEIIFSQLCQAGTSREIEGKAPFSLIIGNASQVSLSYKGKAVDLSKRSKDEVARVTVD